MSPGMQALMRLPCSGLTLGVRSVLIGARYVLWDHCLSLCSVSGLYMCVPLSRYVFASVSSPFCESCHKRRSACLVKCVGLVCPGHWGVCLRSQLCASDLSLSVDAYRPAEMSLIVICEIGSTLLQDGFSSSGYLEFLCVLFGIGLSISTI